MTTDTSIAAREQVAGGTRIVQTACPMVGACLGGSCPVYAHVKDGRIVKFEPVIPGRFCAKGAVWPERIHSPDRILYPLKRTGERGSGKFRRVSWDEALSEIASRLNAIRDTYGHRSIAMYDRAGLAGVRFGQLLGATRISFIGAHGDSPVGAARATGWRNWTDPTGTPGAQQAPGGHAMEDLSMHSNLVIFWACNTAETEQLQMKHFVKAQERGAKLITIDPLFTTTAAMSDQWVPVKVGTDAALALAMIALIHVNELTDVEYMRRHTNGPFLVREDNGRILREADVVEGGDPDAFMMWDERRRQPVRYDDPDAEPALMGRRTVNGIACRTAYQLQVDEALPYTPERAAEITGLPADVIRQLALEYATAGPAAIKKGWGIGRTYHAHHVERMMLTLAAMTGNMGRPGGGVSAISSFQAPPTNRDLVPRLENPVPQVTLDGLTFLKAAAGEEIPGYGPFPIKALLMGGMNFLNQWPGAAGTVERVLPNIDLLVINELVMSDSARFADFVLPVVTPYEKEGVCMPGYYGNLIQYMPKVIDPVGESLSDFEIYRRLGIHMGWAKEFEGVEEGVILPKMWETVPGVTWERIKAEKAFAWEGFNPGATPEHPHVEWAEARFRTPSGRLEFYTEECAPLGDALPTYRERPRDLYDPPGERLPLSLVSYHSKFHPSGAFNEVETFRDLLPDPYVTVHPEDAAARGITNHSIVEVYNRVGRVVLRARLSEGMRPGTIAIMQGWRRSSFLDGAMQELLSGDVINPAHVAMNPVTGADPNAPLHDVWVEVRRVGA
jgi:molybdopterin-containing oxidoreductase family molybdopterin binding subunit